MIKFTQNMVSKGKNKVILNKQFLKNQDFRTSINKLRIIKNEAKNSLKFNIANWKTFSIKQNPFQLALFRFTSNFGTQKIIRDLATKNRMSGLTSRKLAHNFSFYNKGKNKIGNFLRNLKNPLYFYLIGINTGIYLMFSTPIFDRLFLTKNLALSQYSMGNGKLWTLFTYGFVHENFWHFIFNMFTFYFFAR